MKMAKNHEQQTISITPPNFKVIEVLITGTAPLVMERFSKKMELMAKMEEGKAAKSKKERPPRDFEQDAKDARYIAEDGWDGINAGGFRAAMISACRLVGFKMTLAKLSVFVEADGMDYRDGIPLVRIYGEPSTFTAHTRNATGVVDVRSRPMYKRWATVLKVRFDADQFTAQDVLNLVARIGGQVGLGAGRPDSKASAGCGWGTFRIVAEDERHQIEREFGIN